MDCCICLDLSSYRYGNTSSMCTDNLKNATQESTNVNIGVTVYRLGCLLTITACLVALTHPRSSTLNRIPGPPAFPLVGSLLAIGRFPHLSLTDLRRKYGDVYRIHIGKVTIVVINGLGSIREAFVGQRDDFSGRPKLLSFQVASEGKSMAFNSISPTWKSHRRLVESAIKLMITRGRFTDTTVVNEARVLANQFLETATSAPIDPSSAILRSIAHVKYSFCYGDSRQAPDFDCVVKSTLRLIQCHNMGNVINFFPWAACVFPRAYRELQYVCSQILANTQAHERAHLDTYKAGVVRDALDAFIRLGIRRPCGLEPARVLHTVQEFIGAGMDILYRSVTWAVLYLATYQQTQMKIRQELMTVVGLDRVPSSSDMKNMPYVQAFVLETLRHSSVVPFALPHATTCDTRLAGYDIPADTFILANLYSAHHDAEVWGDPDVFRPERFLYEDESRLDEATVELCCPYGVGRRKCVGDHLAKLELFIYVTMLCQQLQIFLEEPPTHTNPGIVLTPSAFTVTVRPYS